MEEVLETRGTFSGIIIIGSIFAILGLVTPTAKDVALIIFGSLLIWVGLSEIRHQETLDEIRNLPP